MIRQYDDRWHLIKGEILMPAVTLEATSKGDGCWTEYSTSLRSPFSINGKFPAAAVEILGPTPEAVADEAQRWRDQAPNIENSSIDLRYASIYSTLDRDLVLGMVMVLSPRRSAEIGPLPSVRYVVLEHIKRRLEIVK